MPSSRAGSLGCDRGILRILTLCSYTSWNVAISSLEPQGILLQSKSLRRSHSREARTGALSVFLTVESRVRGLLLLCHLLLPLPLLVAQPCVSSIPLGIAVLEKRKGIPPNLPLPNLPYPTMLVSYGCYNKLPGA